MDRNHVMVKIATADIDLFCKIFEGYDHIGIASTVKPDEGLVIVHVSPDNWQDACLIIDNMPFPAVILADESEVP